MGYQYDKQFGFNGTKQPVATAPSPLSQQIGIPKPYTPPTPKPSLPAKKPLVFYKDEGSDTVYDNQGTRYSSYQQFLNAGGQDSKVITKKSLTSQIGIPQQKKETPLSDYVNAWMPQPSSELDQEAWKRVKEHTAKKEAEEAQRKAEEAQRKKEEADRIINRSAGIPGRQWYEGAGGKTLTETIKEGILNEGREYIKKAKADPTLNLISTAINNVLNRPTFSERSDEQTGFTLEDKKQALKKGPVGSKAYNDALEIAYIRKNPVEYADFNATGTLKGLMFNKLGSEATTLKALLVAKDPQVTAKILKTIGVEDNLITQFAPKLAMANNEREVTGIVKFLEDMKKTPIDEVGTTKYQDLTPTGQAKARSMGYEPSDDELKAVSKAKESPLTTEARKYKSAEEFVNSFNLMKWGEVTGVGDLPISKLSKSQVNVLLKDGLPTGKGKLGMSANVTDAPNKTLKVGDFQSGRKVFKPIEVSQRGNSYVIENGRHRLFQALANGDESIPVVFKNGEGKGYIKNTKSQLTDIWKKANEAPTPAPKVASRERGFITSAKEAGMDVKGTDTIGVRDTEELAIKAKNLVKDDIVTAEKVAQGTDDKAVAVTSELIKHYDEVAKSAKTTTEKNLALDKISVIANETAKNLTEAGRTVQAAKILSMQTPEGNLRFASGLIQKYNDLIDKKGTGLFGLRKKVPELTGAQAEEILNESKRVFALPEGTEKAMAYQKLQNKIKGLVPSSFFQKAMTLWKAGLLTGIKTTGLNLGSSLSHGVSETIKDVPASVVDKIASVFTGERTLVATTKGKEGIAEGFKKGLRYFKTGYDERNIASKLDYNKVNFTSKGGKVLQAYTDTVFRLLGAEDQPFYYGAKARSLYSQAMAQAKNAGLKGKEYTKFVDDLVANPTDNMIKYATHDAEVAVFQNKTALGDAAKKLQQVGGGAGEVVVPFGRTPASVATQLINYSPIGAVKTLIENVGKGKFDQRMFSQGMGRAITGTGAMYAGMELYKKGKVVLGFPQDEREKRQWELEGKKPNSILIGDKYRSLSILGPLGSGMVVGGYLQRGLEETGSLAESIVQATTGGIKSLTEQTFLQGLNSFTQAITDPVNRGQTLLGNLMGSVVPTIVSDVAQAGDSTQRRTSPTKDGFISPIQGRIPGLRNKLEPKINALGEEVARGGNILETMFDPTRPSKATDSPLIAEFRRLSDTGNAVTPTYFADDKKMLLTPQNKTDLQKDAGTLFKSKVEKLIKLPQYQELSDEDKAKAINKFLDLSRTKAKENYVGGQIDKIKEATKSEKGIVTLINDYAKAFAVDPESAFKTLVTSEQLDKVVGDAVMMERISVQESESIKRKLEAMKGMKLDHTIPLELGGDNSPENLKLRTEEEWASYTQVENKLGRLLKEGTIKEEEAQQLIRDFKDGKISREEILKR